MQKIVGDSPQNLAAQSATNNLADIIQHDYAYITQYATKGLLLDLGPYVKASLKTGSISGTATAIGRPRP